MALIHDGLPERDLEPFDEDVCELCERTESVHEFFNGSRVCESCYWEHADKQIKELKENG